MDLFLKDSLSQDTAAIQKNIRKNFVVKRVKTNENGEELPGTAYWAFKDYDELEMLMRSPPYSMSADDITFIQMIAAFQLDTPVLGKYPLPMNGHVTSLYGTRINPVTGKGTEFHRGIDIEGTWHDKIASIADGEVYRVNYEKSSWGNYVILKHDTEDGVFYSLSAHLSAIVVDAGDKVTVGQVIGFEGGDQEKDPNPGNTTGHHLHFEIWKTTNSGSHTDPAKYILE